MTQNAVLETIVVKGATVAAAEVHEVASVTHYAVQAVHDATRDVRAASLVAGAACAQDAVNHLVETTTLEKHNATMRAADEAGHGRVAVCRQPRAATRVREERRCNGNARGMPRRPQGMRVCIMQWKTRRWRRQMRL